ncbi:hypothetical protein BJF88_01285 [Cellulosimicrobium sp. CUA-896]|nr:hypothetical protein BJF88_01285 [Cellulosimicrobium sp. CUA-896]
MASLEYAGGGGTGQGDPLRSIRLTKQLAGEAAEAVTGTFTFRLDCADTAGTAVDGFPRTAVVGAGGTTTFTGVPVGSVCELTETDDGGADRVAFAPAGPIAVTAGSPATIDVVATNTFDAVDVVAPGDGSTGADLDAGTPPRAEPPDEAVRVVAPGDVSSTAGPPPVGTPGAGLAATGARCTRHRRSPSRSW